uniref:PIPK domain-containing protein n=1 Tax=Chromera velia CCMP2878 TaxID=1169474 RepID=A0A0G4GEM8_9ALVE|eukprot:Cvel_21532.t1-p1 / transcript=Cvel_21532.t1 / gene=Cvel_21532 / organism=Chromera_velia_CCMP2878 / gene_product=1-phosphatidylinositol-3-phosphate 5-kinase FAB1A, putative / transcript_product=1-phosphatidylinositol-3-phosphate 5-kinase FAB1A, putative / location=Cvel_scaffold2028:26853-33888(+) / protein_length=1628 / sequence_SO=supercontig / SO=protein_coding / is_pseudo=false
MRRRGDLGREGFEGRGVDRVPRGGGYGKDRRALSENLLLGDSGIDFADGAGSSQVDEEEGLGGPGGSFVEDNTSSASACLFSLPLFVHSPPSAISRVISFLGDARTVAPDGDGRAEGRRRRQLSLAQNQRGGNLQEATESLDSHLPPAHPAAGVEGSPEKSGGKDEGQNSSSTSHFLHPGLTHSQFNSELSSSSIVASVPPIRELSLMRDDSALPRPPQHKPLKSVETFLDPSEREKEKEKREPKRLPEISEFISPPHSPMELPETAPPTLTEEESGPTIGVEADVLTEGKAEEDTALEREKPQGDRTKLAGDKEGPVGGGERQKAKTPQDAPLALDRTAPAPPPSSSSSSSANAHVVVFIDPEASISKSSSVQSLSLALGGAEKEKDVVREKEREIQHGPNEKEKGGRRSKEIERDVAAGTSVEMSKETEKEKQERDRRAPSKSSSRTETATASAVVAAGSAGGGIAKGREREKEKGGGAPLPTQPPSASSQAATQRANFGRSSALKARPFMTPFTWRPEELQVMEKAMLAPNKGHIRVEFSTPDAAYTVVVFFATQFHILRHFLCGDDLNFVRSIHQSGRLSTSGGKSGASFNVSHDKRFIFKQLSRPESRLFCSSGQAFFQYHSRVLFHGMPSNLTPAYGLFQISCRKKDHRSRETFVVLQNLNYHVEGGPGPSSSSSSETAPSHPFSSRLGEKEREGDNAVPLQRNTAEDTHGVSMGEPSGRPSSSVQGGDGEAPPPGFMEADPALDSLNIPAAAAAAQKGKHAAAPQPLPLPVHAAQLAEAEAGGCMQEHPQPGPRRILTFDLKGVGRNRYLQTQKQNPPSGWQHRPLQQQQPANADPHAVVPSSSQQQQRQAQPSTSAASSVGVRDAPSTSAGSTSKGPVSAAYSSTAADGAKRFPSSSAPSSLPSAVRQTAAEPSFSFPFSFGGEGRKSRQSEGGGVQPHSRTGSAFVSPSHLLPVPPDDEAASSVSAASGGISLPVSNEGTIVQEGEGEGDGADSGRPRELSRSESEVTELRQIHLLPSGSGGGGEHSGGDGDRRGERTETPPPPGKKIWGGDTGEPQTIRQMRPQASERSPPFPRRSLHAQTSIPSLPASPVRHRLDMPSSTVLALDAERPRSPLGMAQGEEEFEDLHLPERDPSMLLSPDSVHETEREKRPKRGRPPLLSSPDRASSSSSSSSSSASPTMIRQDLSPPPGGIRPAATGSEPERPRSGEKGKRSQETNLSNPLHRYTAVHAAVGGGAAKGGRSTARSSATPPRLSEFLSARPDGSTTGGPPPPEATSANTRAGLQSASRKESVADPQSSATASTVEQSSSSSNAQQHHSAKQAAAVAAASSSSPQPPSTSQAANNQQQQQQQQQPVLWDQNFREYTKGYPMQVRLQDMRSIESGIYNDTLLLSKLEVVDYSLLLLVDEEKREMAMGMIDFYRQYTWDKQFESVGKAVVLNAMQAGLTPTVLSPSHYQQRFRQAMKTFFAPPFPALSWPSDSSSGVGGPERERDTVREADGIRGGMPLGGGAAAGWGGKPSTAKGDLTGRDGPMGGSSMWTGAEGGAGGGAPPPSVDSADVFAFAGIPLEDFGYLQRVSETAGGQKKHRGGVPGGYVSSNGRHRNGSKPQRTSQSSSGSR